MSRGKFSNKLQTCSENLAHRTLKDQRGYIFILMCCLIPIILLGTKWVLDTMTLREMQTNMYTNGGVDVCSERAALAVAKNWNPGIGLDRQKRAVLKVADAVYNDSRFGNTPIVSKAVPGLQIKTRDKVILGKGYDPTKVTMKNEPPAAPPPEIEYESKPKYLFLRKIFDNNLENKAAWNLPFVAWKLIDKLTSLSTEYDKFDEVDHTQRLLGNYILDHFDRYQYPHQWWIVRMGNGYPKRDSFLNRSNKAVDVICQLTSSDNNNTNESGYTEETAKNISESSIYYERESYAANGTYTQRKEFNNEDLKITVKDDAIEVTTKFGIGKAKPAECNVDIILACPTNAAATNKNNRDKNSTTSEMPYTSSDAVNTINDDIKACPIYQIGQAFRTFAKEFYHTRGVTMGLIPYSGKVSLDPDVAEGYSKSFFHWNGSKNFHEEAYTSDNGQNEYPAYIRGRALYGSYGLRDNGLNNDYKWNTLLTGCPIFCRTGYNINAINNAYGNKKGLSSQCGGNNLHSGDILSNINPAGNSGDSSHHSANFLRQNSNPCYGGYANLLSMRCTHDCVTYLPNPYYIIEPTADVQKIYEICGAFYPFYDEYNVSNFIFIPITWANNLWQSWTRNPQCQATNTAADGTGGQLSCPSKMTARRKKALILVVNKPDWFEHYELTYLGFDNDFSELPMMESDAIDFSRDYSADSGNHYADGSNYDENIQGPKKILKFTGTNVSRNANSGYYECNGTGSATLSFPKKYLVKVVVEPIMQWEKKGCNLSSFSYNNWYNYGHVGVGPINGITQMLAQSTYGQLACSTDGSNWTNLGQKGSIQWCWYDGLAYGNGIFLRVAREGNNCIQYASDPTTAGNWTQLALPKLRNEESLTFDHGIFMTIAGQQVYTSSTGAEWLPTGTVPTTSRILGCNNNHWIAGAGAGDIYESTDNGATWNSLNSNLKNISSGRMNEWYGTPNWNGYFYIVNIDTHEVVRSKTGQFWEKVSNLNGCTRAHRNITLYNDKLYVISQKGDCCHIGSFTNSIQFSNITAGNITKNTAYENITDRREFYIESSQINNNCTITMDMTNIRLISAEITNRPYKVVKPMCSLDGTNIKTNVKKPMKLKITLSEAFGIAKFTDIDKTVLKGKAITTNNGTPVEITSTSTGSSAEIRFKDPTTITFPAACFSSTSPISGNVLSQRKLLFNLDWADITGVSLANQTLRMSGVYGHYRSISYRDPSIIFSQKHVCGSMWERGGHSWLTSGDCFMCSLQNSWINHARIQISCWIDHRNIAFDFIDKNNDAQSVDSMLGGTYNYEITIPTNAYFFRMKNVYTPSNCAGTGRDGAMRGVYLYNLDGPLTMNLSDFTDTTTHLYVTDGNIINFEGQGDLTISLVKNFVGKSGRLFYTSPYDETIYDRYTGESRFITIDLDKYKYEDDGNGGYIIRLTTDNIEISDLEFVDSDDLVLEWTEIRTPNHSRYVNYTTDSCAAYGTTLGTFSSNFLNYWRYNANKKSYINTQYNCKDSAITLNQITGDHTDLTFANDSYSVLHFTSLGKQTDNEGRMLNNYLTSGLTRAFTQFDCAVAGHKNNSKDYMYNDYDGNVGTIGLFQQCITLPVNTALWYAYYDKALHEGEWYKDPEDSTGKTIKYDASEAAKNATKKALEKLVATYGAENTRVYVILFRKQDNYKQIITEETLNYSYDYLDNANVYKVYDIATEEALQELMQTIAKEIKTWSGYKPAENIAVSEKTENLEENESKSEGENSENITPGA